MNIRQTVDALHVYGRICMVEGVLQGRDLLGLAEYDGEYTSYAKDIMKAASEGVFTTRNSLSNFLSEMGGLDLDLNPSSLSNHADMIWNIVRHDLKRG